MCKGFSRFLKLQSEAEKPGVSGSLGSHNLRSARQRGRDRRVVHGKPKAVGEIERFAPWVRIRMPVDGDVQKSGITKSSAAESHLCDRRPNVFVESILNMLSSNSPA